MSHHKSTYAARYHQTMAKRWGEQARLLLLDHVLTSVPKSSYWAEEATHYQKATAEQSHYARRAMGIE